MWFGREGRHGVCMVVNSCCDFQTMTATHIYLCLHSINNLFLDHVNSFSSKEKKKDNKKAS
jgi:hypothetical protein